MDYVCIKSDSIESLDEIGTS